MDKYRVTLYEKGCDEGIAFDCEADDFGHAEEQARDSYKGCDVTKVRRLAKANGRTLRFKCRGEWHECSLEPETLGHVVKSGDKKFALPHPTWIVRGFSAHHMQNRVTAPLSPTMEAAEAMGGYVWDLDHGTARTWGGRYDGKTPRVREAFLSRLGAD